MLWPRAVVYAIAPTCCWRRLLAGGALCFILISCFASYRYSYGTFTVQQYGVRVQYRTEGFLLGKITKPGPPRPKETQNPVLSAILQNPVLRAVLQNPVPENILQNPVPAAHLSWHLRR